jgi:tetratricopeptide (TPR) repeat protein
MGKKRKKGRKASGSNKLPVDVLERKALESLRAGRFREARDYFKRLCSRDRAKYISGLIESYQGLFSQLMEQGRLDEAKVILANMEKLGSMPSHARVMLALKQKDFAGAMKEAAKALFQSGNGSGESKHLMADALVLAFDQTGQVAPIAPVYTDDLTRIHCALERVSEKSYEEALNLIRPIGSQSLFAHWKWFIKGLCAFYGGQDDKARKVFDRLPTGSGPAKAAKPYLLLLQGADSLHENYRNIDMLEQICLLTGRKEMAEVLPRAEYLWRVGRFRDSYGHIRNSLSAFPSEEPGILNALSVFYFNSLLHMEEGQAEKYMDFLFESAWQDGKSNSVQEIFAHRAESLFLERVSRVDEEIEDSWEDFLEAYRAVHGENSSLQALVYAHLGDLFSQEEPESPFCYLFGGRQNKSANLRNPYFAEFCYQRSAEICPDSRETHMALLRLYEKTNNKSNINRKLDELIARFPDDKDALFKAGLRCIERNALIKGMKYLERALELDPLDGKLREGSIIARIKAALRHAQNGRIQNCRDLLPGALEKASGRSADLTCGRPYLYARWAAFELLCNQEAEARRLMDRGLGLDGQGLKFRYFSLLIARVYGVAERFLLEMEKPFRDEFSAPEDPAKALIFVETLDYFKTFPNLDWLCNERQRLNGYVSKAAKRPFSRDQARVIVEYALFGTGVERKPAMKYIDKILKQNPDDPLFLFYRFALSKAEGLSFRHSPRHDLEELRRILLLAKKDGNTDLVGRIRKAMEELEKLLAALDALNPLLGELTLDEEDDLPLWPTVSERPPKKRRRGKSGHGSQASLF